jgi:type IV secretion system protein VirB3
MSGRGAAQEGVLARDTVFVALTRPQMFAGVTYSFFVINLVISTEAFLIFRSVWALALALAVHGAGWVACLRDARMFDVWLVRARRCPRLRNYRFWQCNSYRA